MFKGGGGGATTGIGFGQQMERQINCGGTPHLFQVPAALSLPVLRKICAGPSLGAGIGGIRTLERIIAGGTG